eukprot:CAMPEP_0168621108 /NCGR_PEP_ID=MMETSP0449_2-20121227/7510_1 /TAXON_ID=1082188 /ORGANISM="Strombidium rassoulzadegani, Strain ras09" /LENGTH=307 /DNA_ID=CAMNT_0008662189 /DNA_START=170 /DNA_END=1092 /DNA_ORIENTATION=+
MESRKELREVISFWDPALWTAAFVSHVDDVLDGDELSQVGLPVGLQQVNYSRLEHLQELGVLAERGVAVADVDVLELVEVEVVQLLEDVGLDNLEALFNRGFEGNEVWVDFDGRLLLHESEELDELALLVGRQAIHVPADSLDQQHKDLVPRVLGGHEALEDAKEDEVPLHHGADLIEVEGDDLLADLDQLCRAEELACVGDEDDCLGGGHLGAVLERVLDQGIPDLLDFVARVEDEGHVFKGDLVLADPLNHVALHLLEELCQGDLLLKGVAEVSEHFRVDSPHLMPLDKRTLNDFNSLVVLLSRD